jgi:histone H3
MARTKQELNQVGKNTGKKLDKKKQGDKAKAVVTKEVKRKSALQSAGGIKKPHRFRRGTVARRLCRKYQNGRTIDGTRTLIPKTLINRLIREKASAYDDDLRFKPAAFRMIQDAVEDRAVKMFYHATRVTKLRKMQTVTSTNLAFVLPFFFPHFETDVKRQLHNAAERKRVERQSIAQATSTDDASQED